MHGNAASVASQEVDSALGHCLCGLHCELQHAAQDSYLLLRVLGGQLPSSRCIQAHIRVSISTVSQDLSAPQHYQNSELMAGGFYATAAPSNLHNELLRKAHPRSTALGPIDFSDTPNTGH